jgi:hypothetical protein
MYSNLGDNAVLFWKILNKKDFDKFYFTLLGAYFTSEIKNNDPEC